MYRFIKRFLDILLSTVLLVLLSPLIILTAAAVLIESGWPVIFKQPRLGRQGRVFNMYKFRSMIKGAESGGVYCGKGDGRVTRVGKLIRATSLDELPQLWNILRGDMSIVGPRPPLTYHPWSFEEYSDEQRRMFLLRPGVTGWAQVNGRKDVEWNRRIELNVYYVTHMSFWLDVRILFRTVWKVIAMKDNFNIEETAKVKEPL